MLFWTGRDERAKPDDLDDALSLMIYTTIGALYIALLAIFG